MAEGIILDHVSFHYPTNPETLTDISLSIAPGTFLGITGVNGSGKSTFTYLLNGLIPHSIPGALIGDVRVDGVSTKQKDVAYFSHLVGMVFQNPDFSLFNLTVSEEIAFGLKHFAQPVSDAHIERILGIVGLVGFAGRDPQSLSFGEKQKVCLACVLALDVPYIVLDEPTAMLDYKSSQELYRLLASLNRKGKTIIVVEHDTDYVWKYTHETLIVQKGTIVAYGKTKDILSQNVLLEKLFVKRPNTKKL